MVIKKERIKEYRERMDKTLACDDLVNEESIKKIVMKHFSFSSSSETTQENNEYLLERRSKEVKNFLDLMRSASGDDHNKPGDWKVKEDNEEYRVMYREGAQGSPFHTLLVEGYADAPMDVCLCAAWEAALYKKWWPQINFPTFKIMVAKSLQKIRIGECLSLVRMKVTWPLAAREIIVHLLEIEYLEDGMIVGLINSVPDIENVTKQTHGFSNEGIPEAKDIVRMDLIGGTAMKKLSQNKTYYRTVGNMDIKLDIAPTWLINFIARQLIGGACKLYQKTVAAVAKGDEDFEEALKDSLYVRIREGLNSDKKLKINSEQKAIESGKSTMLLTEQHEIEDKEIEPDSDPEGNEEEEIEPDLSDLKKNEEQETKPDESDFKKNDKVIDHYSIDEAVEQCYGNGSKENKVSISPKVQEALGMLENVIDLVQKGELGNKNGFEVESINHEVVNSEPVVAKVGMDTSTNGPPGIDNINKGMDDAKNDSDVHNSRFVRPTYPIREVYHNRIAPASLLETTVPLTHIENEGLKSSHEYEEVGDEVNATNEGSAIDGREKKKKWRYSCVHFISILI